MRATVTAALVGLLIGAGVAVGAPRMGTFRPPIGQIQDNATLMPYEPALNLSGTGVSCVDDGANMRTTCTITSGGGGDGGVTDATYITQTPNASLSNEQALSLNSTGIMISTTGTGVVSTYAGTSCTNQFPRSLNASGAATCASVALAADVSGTLLTSNGGTGTPFGSVFKAVRVTTTANISSLSGLLTVDGVTVASGDRVLVKNQTAATENGVYVAASGAWSFALDWGTGAVVPMMVVDVAEGTQNQHSTWVLNTTGVIVVGATALSFGPLNTNFPSRWPLTGSTVRVSATDPNADFQTIQTAIDATGPAPSLILVGAGTYAESLTISGTRTVKIQGMTGQSTLTANIFLTTASTDVSLVTLTATSGPPGPDVEFENLNFQIGNTAPDAGIVSLFRSIESGFGSDGTTRLSLKNCVGTLSENGTTPASHSISAIKSISTAHLSTAVTLKDTSFSVSNGSGPSNDVSVWQLQGVTSTRKDTLTLLGSNTLSTTSGAANTKSVLAQANSNNSTTNWGSTLFSQSSSTLPAFTVSPGTLFNNMGAGFARPGGTAIKFFDSMANVFNSSGATVTNYVGEWTSTSPLVPTEGASVFSRKRAARNQAAQIGTTNRWREFGSNPYGTKIGIWDALGNSTTVGLLGLANSATGTATTRNVATTNLSTSMRRLGFVSAAVAGSSAGTRNGTTQWWFGNAAGLGGFFYSTRFIISATSTNVRWFVGMSGTAGALANANPTTLLNLIGFSIDSAQTTVRFINNDGSGTATATDLGASFPATTTTAVYEARLFVAPNTTVVNYSLERLDSAALVEGSVNSNIPSNTTFLSPQLWINNGTDAVAVAIDVAQQYIETDF